jgi:hypothetical protein
LQASAEATIYQTPAWLDACCASGDLEDVSRLYEMLDGRQIVIPMVRRRGGRRWGTTRSMPDGWGFGGAIATGRLAPEDVSTLFDDPLVAGARLTVKPGPLSDHAWTAAPARERVPHCLHVVDLREGFERLWSTEFSSGTRNKVRKAEKRGVEVRWGPGTELAKVHWDIYLRWATRRAKARGIPVALGLALARREESAERFETVARCLGERCRVLVAWVDGQAVASTVVLSYGAFAHYWRSASDQEADRSRFATYLMLARLLEDATEEGREYLEMGESSGVRSLIAFKEQFGAKPWTYDELLFGPRLLTRATRTRDHLMQDASDVTIGAFKRLKRLRDRSR